MRSVALALVLLLACGKPTGASGGLLVEVNYTLLGGSSGCVKLSAAPFEGPTREATKALDGEPRQATLRFGVGRSADWPSSEVTLFASLFEATCTGAPVAQASLTRDFPTGRVDTVVMDLEQRATAGGAGGGSATAGGGTAGGATAGGANAGGGTAGGSTAGGATAGGATAGGATAGGGTAGGGTAGGGTAGGAPMPAPCDGGFVRITTPFTGVNHDVAIVGPGDVWITGASQPYVARVTDAGAVSPGPTGCGATFYSAWARSDGRVYLGAASAVYRLDGVAGMCTVLDSVTSGNVEGLWGAPLTGTQQQLFAVTTTGHVGYMGDGVTVSRADEHIADDLHAIDGFSSVDLFAAGASGGSSKGAIFHFDGGTWESSYSDGSNGTTFFALSFVSPTLGWAAGDKGALMRWNGASWTTDMAVPSGFTVVRGIKAFSASAIYVVGNADRIMKWDGSAWIKVGDAIPPGTELEQIRGENECDLWVTGRSGFVATTRR